MSGLDLDHALLYQARKFITPTNVHYVKTCIFCYEISAPHSEYRKESNAFSVNSSARKIDYWLHGRARTFEPCVMRRADY